MKPFDERNLYDAIEKWYTNFDGFCRNLQDAGVKINFPLLPEPKKTITISDNKNVNTEHKTEQIIFAPKAEDMYYCEKCDSAWWYDDEGELHGSEIPHMCKENVVKNAEHKMCKDCVKK